MHIYNLQYQIRTLIKFILTNVIIDYGDVRLVQILCLLPRGTLCFFLENVPQDSSFLLSFHCLKYFFVVLSYLNSPEVLEDNNLFKSQKGLKQLESYENSSIKIPLSIFLDIFSQNIFPSSSGRIETFISSFLQTVFY